LSSDLFNQRSPVPADDGVRRREAPAVAVSAYVAEARATLERRLPLTWIAGEVSNCSKAPSGHLYFRLKDAHAQAQCVMYRLRNQHLTFSLKDGLRVEVRATATLYEARGEFQLNVDAMRLAGVGVLYERFARLKAQLAAEGLFDQGRKRPLPKFPKSVGIVTSPRAAALRDILTTLRRRWPRLQVVLYPTAVQGPEAAGEIARALALANELGEVDVIIVGRGGGSIEDLWPFNEEAVARAVFASRLPVVSGVGHETDFTICDFVADVRAATPTAAAALVCPDRAVLADQVGQVFRGLHRALLHAQHAREQRLDHAMRRLVHPAARAAAQRARVDELARRLHADALGSLGRQVAASESLRRRLLRELRSAKPAAQRVAALAQNLAHLNPEAVLTRGYAIVSAASGAIVTDAQQVAVGDRVDLRLARGGVRATVDDKR
jgi:exodeoxyribonuclease VII large subunit